MTAHLCTELTPGCYRCDLNRDELEAQQQEITAERAQLAQGLCPRLGMPIMRHGILRPVCSLCDCGDPS